MSINQIIERIPQQGPLLLVFDRDGTLVPYANHPDDAHMDEELKVIMKGLANSSNVIVAMLSARSVRDLERDFSQNDKVVLSGNYGLELKLENGTFLTEDRAQMLLPELKTVKLALEGLTNRIDGLILEDHRLSLCLHWHNVAEDKLSGLKQEMEALGASLQKLKLMNYPTSFEVFPDFTWTKGDGLRLIEKHCGLGDEKHVLFAGDTDSDEPAMEQANQWNGSSIRVGKGAYNSAAKYQFESPTQVKELLSQILNHRD